MAVAYNSDAAGWSTSSAASSISQSFSVGSGATALIVGATMDTNTDFAATATYNGVSMTKLMQQLQQYSALFGLISPAIGANTLAVSWNASQVYGIGAFSVTGSDLTTAFGTAVGTASASSTNNSRAVSTASANNLVVDVTAVNAVASLTSTKTQRWTNGDTGGINNHWGSGSTAAATGGTVTMGYTFAAQRNSIIAVEVLEAAAVSGNPWNYYAQQRERVERLWKKTKGSIYVPDYVYARKAV